MGWWTPELAEKLSQGDIVSNQAAVIAAHPLTYLKPKDFKGGIPGWAIHPVPVEANGRVHLLATGSARHCLVLSHDCELDKEDGNPERRRVVVAPTYALASVMPEHQAVILQQENRALMPLVEVPGSEPLYADFRSICSVPRLSVDAATRKASMTEEARLRLRAQLVAFFLRLQP